MTKTKPRISVLLSLFLCSAVTCAKETWFNNRVTWKYGKDGQPWKTFIKEPNEKAEYQLVLRPLWAVEGGVLALEIAVVRPKQPDINLLGERENGVEYPFVITVEELEQGLVHSKFGTLRKVEAEKITANIKIERFRLGKGVGDCSKCSNLQELSLWITLSDK